MTFTVEKPELIPLAAEGMETLHTDPYEILEDLKHVEGDADEADGIREILGKLINVKGSEISIQSAWDFKEYVCQSCNKLNEARKKKVEQIVYSLQPTPESLPDSSTGAIKPSNPGSTTSATSEASSGPQMIV